MVPHRNQTARQSRRCESATPSRTSATRENGVTKGLAILGRSIKIASRAFKAGLRDAGKRDDHRAQRRVLETGSGLLEVKRIIYTYLKLIPCSWVASTRFADEARWRNGRFRSARRQRRKRRPRDQTPFLPFVRSMMDVVLCPASTGTSKTFPPYSRTMSAPTTVSIE